MNWRTTVWIACLWFPYWPLGRADAPRWDDPALVVESGRVVAVSPTVDDDIRIGMERRAAESLMPGAVVLERDPGEEMQRFENVIREMEEVVPRVEVVAPGTVLIDIGGALRYYGGVEKVVEELTEAVAALGDEPWRYCRVGVAQGPFAAGIAARTGPTTPHIVTDTNRYLAGLDLGVMADADRTELVVTFRWLGINTLGEVARLPRDVVVSRFGPIGLEVHRLASGEDRPTDPRPIPVELAVEAHYEDPLVELDSVAFVSRQLAARLTDSLREEGLSIHQVVVEMTRSDGVTRSRTWRSTDPLIERTLSDRIWWQLRAWLEEHPDHHLDPGIPPGIIRIRIDPSRISGEGRQLSFWEDTTSMIETERALGRAQALVGPDRVVVGYPEGGRLPAERTGWRRWGEPEPPADRDPDAPWPGATPSPAPALVPPRPQPLAMEWDGGMPVRVRMGSRWEPVLSWSGPWRLMGRWWNGEGNADRYQIVTSVGAILCVVWEGKTYLAGVYD
ncbi:MAG: hypothetical protein GEU79_08265 [Acidimicrobiia bacterium]|nr:hypothetical protein [Acidimicrobiia bacterium]